MPSESWFTLSYVAQTLLWLGLTAVAYWLGLLLYRASHGRPYCHPLVTTSVLVCALLFITHTEVADYQGFAYPLHWLLGPATVALAVPLYRQLRQIQALGIGILLPVIFGGTLAPLIAFLILYFGGGSSLLWHSMLTKSITTPLAMQTTISVGGSAPLAAVFVILTGIVGAMFAALIFRLANIRSSSARGLALGTVAHAVGTAQAFQLSEKSGVFATVALCINGVLTAIILPLIFVFLE
jgi:putative effector of murein hydrolase